MFYLDLFRCLHARNVRYVLAGGLAMNLHGVPRMTMDVDLVIALDDANVDAFLQCARDLALKPDNPTVDILLKHSLDFDAALKRAVAQNVDDVPIRIASVDDMIALKQNTGRRQDSDDLEHLLRLRGRQQ